MNGTNIRQTLGAILFLLAMHVTPVAAQTPQTVPADSMSPLSFGGESESKDDALLSVGLTEGNKRRAKRNLRTILRGAGREWPRLMLRYAQPAVRGLLADRQTGSNTLALKTTLFRDNTKGLHLAGGFARNSWGEREARLQFSARF